MNVYELAKRRKTVREFSSDPINLEDVLYAIQTAKEAPSGANKQPWLYILVTDPSIKKRIRSECEEVERVFHERAPSWMKKWFKERNITWKKPFLTEAPILLLVFANKNEPHAIQSVWLSIGYLLLALEEKQLVTVTYTPSGYGWANNLLNIPKNYSLQVILPIGRAKPDIKYRKQPRKSLQEITFLNSYGQPLTI